MKTPEEIKIALRMCSNWDKNCEECPYKPMKRALSCSAEMKRDSLAYIDQLEKKTKWISVEERLPEDGETALTYKNGLVEAQVYEKKRNGWIKGNWFWSMATVTHWMPLPEPPKEGLE